MDQSSIEKWFLFKEVLQDYPQDIGPQILYFYLLKFCRVCKEGRYPLPEWKKCVNCHMVECSLHQYVKPSVGMGSKEYYCSHSHQCVDCKEWICSTCITKRGFYFGAAVGALVIRRCNMCYFLK
jgi:hypothetical protein